MQRYQSSAIRSPRNQEGASVKTRHPASVNVLRILGIALTASLAWPQLAGAQSSPQPATNLGPEDPDTQISLTVWLNLHNRSTLDALVQDMYDKTSASYHRFLT